MHKSKELLFSKELEHYLDSKFIGNDNKNITRGDLADIYVVVNNPNLENYPRLVSFLGFFVAFWNNLFTYDYEVEKEYLYKYNNVLLGRAAKIAGAGLSSSDPKKKIFSLARQLLFSKKINNNEARFVGKQEKLDLFICFKNIFENKDELNYLFADTPSSLKKTFDKIADLKYNKKEFFEEKNQKDIENLHAILLYNKELVGDQKVLFKMVLDSMTVNQGAKDLIDLHKKILNVLFINKIPHDQLVGALAESLSSEEIIKELQGLAIAANWDEGLEEILNLSVDTPFHEQLSKYLTVEASENQVSIFRTLMTSMEELSNTQLPIEMRIDKKTFMKGFLENFTFVPGADEKENRNQFFTSLEAKVNTQLLSARATQHAKLDLLAKKFGGQQFAEDIKHYPKSADEAKRPVMESAFVVDEPEVRVEVLFKHTMLAQGMTAEQFEEIFPQGLIAYAFTSFQKKSCDISQRKAVELFYAKLGKLVALRSQILSENNLFANVKALFNGDSTSNEIAKKLANIWIAELLNNVDSGVEEWAEPLNELVSCVTNIGNDELNFHPDIIFNEIRKFAYDNGFNVDAATLTKRIQSSHNLAKDFTLKCQETSCKEHRAQLAKAFWVNQLTAQVKVDNLIGTPFIDEFKAFFKGGVVLEELEIYANAIRKGSDLVLERSVEAKEVAKGYAAFFNALRSEGKELRMPRALELAPYIKALPPLKDWENLLTNQLTEACGEERGAKLSAFFIAAAAKENWAPKENKELRLTLELIKNTFKAYQSGEHAQNDEAFDAVATGCVNLLQQFRVDVKPIEVSRKNLAALYWTKLPELDGWRDQMQTPLQQNVLEELSKNDLRGPVSKQEVKQLKALIEHADGAVKKGQYSEAVAVSAVRRLVKKIRDENGALHDLTNEKFLQSCFDGYLEALLPDAAKGDVEAVITLLSCVKDRDIPLTVMGKACLEKLVKFVASAEFAGGRGVDHFRSLMKLPDLLNAIHLSSVDMMNHYEFEPLLDQLFEKLNKQLFNNLNVRELFNSLAKDPSSIALLLEPVIRSLSGQTELDEGAKNNLTGIVDVLSKGKNAEVALKAFTSLLTNLYEAGGVEVNVDVSTEKVFTGFLKGIIAVKEHALSDETENQTEMQKAFSNLAVDFSRAQKMRGQPLEKTEPLVELLDDFKSLPKGLLTLMKLGAPLGSGILSLPVIGPWIEGRIAAVISTLLKAQVETCEADIDLLNTVLNSSLSEANAYLAKKLAVEENKETKEQDKDKITFLKKIIARDVEGRKELLQSKILSKELFTNLADISPIFTNLGMNVVKNLLDKVDFNDYRGIVDYIIELSHNPGVDVDTKRLEMMFYGVAETVLTRLPEFFPNIFENAVGGLKALAKAPNTAKAIPVASAPVAAVKAPIVARQAVRCDQAKADRLSEEFKKLAQEEFSLDGYVVFNKEIKSLIKEKGLISIFAKEFNEIFGSKTMSSKQVEEIVSLVELAASLINDENLSADEVVKGCRLYCEDRINNGKGISSPSSWLDSDKQDELLRYMHPSVIFKKLAAKRFDESFIEFSDSAATKKAARALYPAFAEEFFTVFNDPSFSEDQHEEIVNLLKMAADMVFEKGCTHKEAVKAVRAYADDLLKRGEKIKAPSADLYPYAFDQMVKIMTEELISEGIGRRKQDSDAFEDFLAEKISFHFNYKTLGKPGVVLNAKGRAALKAIIATFMDNNFAPGRELLDTNLLQRRHSIFEDGLTDISALNDVEDPSSIREKLIHEANVRFEKLNLGRLQAVVVEKPIESLLQICHPVIRTLMSNATTAKKNEAKQLLKTVVENFASKRTIQALLSTMQLEVGQFSFLNGVDLDVEISLQQLAGASRESLKGFSADLAAGTQKDLAAHGLLPKAIVRFASLIIDAQAVRQDPKRNTGANVKPGTSNEAHANLMDKLRKVLGPVIKGYELFVGDKLFGEDIASAAVAASDFVSYIVKKDSVKLLIGGLVKLYFVYKKYDRELRLEAIQDLVQDVDKENPSQVLEILNAKLAKLNGPRNQKKRDYLMSIVADLKKGEKASALEYLQKKQSNLEEAQVIAEALDSHIDDLVKLMTDVISSVLNRHDLSKHGELFAHLLEIIVNPKKNIDSKALVECMVSSVNELLKELPEYYGGLIPDVLGSLASMQVSPEKDAV